MTNKELLTERLKKASKNLSKELDYYLNYVEHEEIPDYDITDAFDDYINIMLQDPTQMLCAVQVENNPLNEILHWSVGNLDRYINFHNIKTTDAQKEDFLNNHSECHECGAWFRGAWSKKRL